MAAPLPAGLPRLWDYVATDLCLRVFDAHPACEATAEFAERFVVCPASVRRLLHRHREAGSLEMRSGRTRPRRNAEQPDHTPAVVAALRPRASAPTAWPAFRTLGRAINKEAAHVAERDRPDVRAAWQT